MRPKGGFEHSHTTPVAADELREAASEGAALVNWRGAVHLNQPVYRFTTAAQPRAAHQLLRTESLSE